MPIKENNIELEIKDTTDTNRSASYLDLHLEIDSEGWFRTKLYNKKDDFNFLIVNLHSYVATFQQHLHMKYISLLIRYSRACGSYHDFLDRELMLTMKLLNQGFLVVKLKSSLWKFYGHHHDLVNCYVISVSHDHGCSVCSNHNKVISSFVTYHWICNKSNMRSVTSGAGSDYPSRAPEFTLAF